MESKAFDFIIVGGGLVGLVLAARLSEDPSAQVLVIEAGEDLTADPRVKIPALSSTLVGTSADWCLQTTPQKSLHGRQLAQSAGRTLGGSSAINSHTFTPTSRANVDAWAGLGNPGWDWSSFSKSLESSYTLKQSPWATKGSGPLQLSIAEENTKWPQLWRDAISKLGYPTSMDPFSGQFLGALGTPESIDPATHQKSFAGSAYLSAAEARENLTIWTQTLVDKVLFDKRGGEGKPVATGVQYTKDGKTGSVDARKEVILSAGAINSPKILELSGVGDAGLLKSLGIDVVVDNAHVGENLQNHPLVGMTFEVLQEEGFETIDNLIRQDPETVAATMESYTKNGSGPFSRSAIDITAQLPLSDTVAAGLDRVLQDTSYETADLGKATDAFAKAHRSFVHSIVSSQKEASAQYMTIAGFGVFAPDGNRAVIPPGSEGYFSVAILLASPLSRGSVHIRAASSSSPDLALDLNCLSNPLDLEILARHVQQVEKIMTTEPFASHLVPNDTRNPGSPPPGSLSNLENAKEYVRKSAVCAHHYTGTCSMMPREIGGVVDPQLRVYGCENLRVCDASIIPITPRASPQATVYGVAEHGAKIIKSVS
ncbi:putative GMC oxidoreductase [Hypoxylon rubiginosum]|uniref:GMC oxidoreductase n=1 Tax=Hypoxylon rubiginosum TaxID=110542 RepID=A0ACB9Z180_9PEZI|nr:putative GMC oxidoreductase [Hypoxylon rubiginosum]